MKLTFKTAAENTSIVLMGFLVLGLGMGGVFWLPVVHYTRDPWQTILLAVALAITIFGIGLGIGAPINYLLLGWLLSSVLLVLVHRASGGLGGSVERFGFVHLFAIIIAFLSQTVAKYVSQ